MTALLVMFFFHKLELLLIKVGINLLFKILPIRFKV